MADEGFFSRWSKRKAEARKEEDPAVRPEPPVTVRPEPVEGRAGQGAGASTSPARTEGVPAPTEAVPAPTLADTQSLTPADDFRRFVAPDVDPQVKNAALKKLFTDPHFNTMDGLDVYIDDYSKPDPLPAAMARQLVGAKFLRLFDEDEEKSTPPAQGREVVDDPAVQSVAQSGAADPAVPPDDERHADPDLRLQQDHAPGPAGPGAKPE